MDGRFAHADPCRRRVLPAELRPWCHVLLRAEPALPSPVRPHAHAPRHPLTCTCPMCALPPPVSVC